MEPLTIEQQAKVDYLRSSVRLQAPETETDPDYIYEDKELWSILETVTPTHNRKYTIDNLPKTEFHFIIMLAKKEVYYRLSTSTAPFYPLSAEGAELKKNVRFDHYLALVKQVSDDYNTSISIFNNSYFGEVQTYESVTQSGYFTTRNYNQSIGQDVKLDVTGITSNSINLDWSKFDINNGLFARYDIYVEEEPTIDEYAETRVRRGANAKNVIYDIHRLKCRIDKLKPDTTYYVCVKTTDRNGLYGYMETEIKTLPIS